MDYFYVANPHKMHNQNKIKKQADDLIIYKPLYNFNQIIMKPTSQQISSKNQTTSTQPKDRSQEIEGSIKAHELLLPEKCDVKESSEILVSPNPLLLQVDTPTDWPTVVVGVGGILITLLVGWLSYTTQRSQIRSNVANFRQSWAYELRDTSAKFLGCVAQLHWDIQSDQDFLLTKDSNRQFSEIIMLQSKIELMLDKKNIDLGDSIDEIIIQLKANDKEKLTASINRFLNIMRDELENAWQETKNDLAGKKEKRRKQTETSHATPKYPLIKESN